MEKITKKDIKAIRGGNHAKLMECLDFLLDSYEEDKYDLGYGACLSDMSVRSQRLAEYIVDMATKYGNRGNDEINYLTVEQTAKAIEDYFNEALNQ